MRTDILNETAFPNAIKLQHGWAGETTVHDVWGAWECLTGDWPAVKGYARRRAELACRDVMDGFGSTERAYDAFLDAVEEAGIPFSVSAAPANSTTRKRNAEHEAVVPAFAAHARRSSGSGRSTPGFGRGR